MEDSLFSKKNKDEINEQKENSKRKIILTTVAILFFSSVAILSMLLETKDNSWTIRNTSIYNSFNDSSNSKNDNLISNIKSNNPQSNALTVSNSDSQNSDLLTIYIVGEIKKPGIYKVSRGIFLYKLIETAGGITSNAAKNYINMVFEINDTQMIKIPSNADIKNNDFGGGGQGLILSNTNGFSNDSEIIDNPSSKIPAKININTASINQLDTLPGIGQATAKLIVDYRTKNGKFKVIADIMKIPGIKESKFSQIKDYITV